MSKRALKPVELNLDEPGKDLSHLFTSSLSHLPDVRQATTLPVDRLLDNPYQPRTHMQEESLNELARVIGGQGFQGVLVARPHPERKGYYQLAAGHRRREASRRAGLSALPVIVRELTDEELVTLAITENIQRDDLTPLEEGRIYLLMNTEMGYKLEQIAREVGKTLGYIYNRVRVAKAPPDVQALVQEKPDSLRAVANLIKVKGEADRAAIIKQLLAGDLTTDDLPVYIERLSADNARREAESAPVTRATPQTPENAGTEERQNPGEPALDTHHANITVGPASSTEESAAPPQPYYSKVLVNGVEMVVEKESAAFSQEGGQQAAPGRVPGTAGRDELARIRARKSKLSRMLAMLQSFSDQLNDDTDLSQEERLELATVAVLAERLCERFGIPKAI